MVYFGPENGTSHNSGLDLKNFFKILQSESGQKVHENFISCFSRKKFIWDNLIFLPLSHFLLFSWAWSNCARPLLIGSLSSQDMISFTVTTGFLNIQDMIRILKQGRHGFPGKHLFGGYCMDIVWCLCVEVKIQGFVNLLYEFIT